MSSPTATTCGRSHDLIRVIHYFIEVVAHAETDDVIDIDLGVPIVELSGLGK